MKSTGITRQVDRLGRFVLPIELRKAYGLEEGSTLEILTEGDTILLRKYRPAGSCELCGELDDEPVQYRGRYFCAACRSALAKL